MQTQEEERPISETQANVRLPAKTRAELEKLAEENERSLGAEIRVAIRLYLEQAA